MSKYDHKSYMSIGRKSNKPHKSAFPEILEALATESLPHLSKLSGRRERRAAEKETRVRLFRSALRLFAQRGFQNVTVEDITDAADVGKGTFFNYFESKEQVLGVMAEIQLGKVREVLELAEAGKQSVRSVLRSLFQRVSEEPGRSPEMTRALICHPPGQRCHSLHYGRYLRRRPPHGGENPGTRSERGEVRARSEAERLARQGQQSVIGLSGSGRCAAMKSLETRLEDGFQHFWRAVTLNKEATR